MLDVSFLVEYKNMSKMKISSQTNISSQLKAWWTTKIWVKYK